MSRIRVFDTETQGFEPTDKVCELGWCDLVSDSDGRWITEGPYSTLHFVETMPAPARAVHHISAADTAGFPPFDPDVMWAQVIDQGVDVVAAHNAAFDGLRWGEPQRPVLCTYKAALRVWPDAPSHGNGALRYWLEDWGLLSLDIDKTMPPHRAGPDAYVTAHVLKALLDHATARDMVAWTRQPALLPRCPIGEPWRGKKWAEVDGGFLQWMVNKPVEPDLVWNAQQELDRRRMAQ